MAEATNAPKKKSSRKLYAEHVAAGLCRWTSGDGELCPHPASARPVISARLARACDSDEPETNWSGGGDRMCPTHAQAIADNWRAEMWHPADAPPGLFVDRHGTEWWDPTFTVEPAAD